MIKNSVSVGFKNVSVSNHTDDELSFTGLDAGTYLVISQISKIEKLIRSNRPWIRKVVLFGSAQLHGLSLVENRGLICECFPKLRTIKCCI